ncbi:unnamed protein product, partial [Enterobius vermicularis]|uniref:Proteasome maturation protein n=1 Tax=Enterobius vermicularis TaxID=51028 RepID=A0A0N4VJ26_ENTVE
MYPQSRSRQSIEVAFLTGPPSTSQKQQFLRLAITFRNERPKISASALEDRTSPFIFCTRRLPSSKNTPPSIAQYFGQTPFSPSVPETPACPGKPGRPFAPCGPGEPGGPGEPSGPTTPSSPADPNGPSSPGNPGSPIKAKLKYKNPFPIRKLFLSNADDKALYHPAAPVGLQGQKFQEALMVLEFPEVLKLNLHLDHLGCQNLQAVPEDLVDLEGLEDTEYMAVPKLDHK